MTKNKVVVFDFDGTLCDSFQVVINMLNRYGHHDMNKNELVRDMTMKEITRQMGISSFRLPYLANQFRRELQKEIPMLTMFPGIEKVLSTFSNQGLQIGVLTSNSKENVMIFLHKYGVAVDFIYSKSSLFGKHRVLKKMMRDLNVKSTDILHVGDEVRDIEASKKAGVKIAAVTWGFNSKKILLTHEPDYVVHEPQQLLTIDW